MSQYPTKLSQLSNLIEHVAETAAKVIPRISAYKPGVDEACIPFIDDFVLYVTIRSYTTVPELMMSLIYLSWFRNRLPPSVTGRSSTPHRVFLAALMLAHKVHNDDSANNTCWADLSVIPECSFAGFSKVEVNLMERQFLAGLDWNLHINVDVYDLLSREVCTTPSYSSRFLQSELVWDCGCCVCVDWWASPTQGLSHCFACLTPSYPEVLAMEQSHVLQRSAVENDAFGTLHHQVEPAYHDASAKCNTAPTTNAF